MCENEILPWAYQVWNLKPDFAFIMVIIKSYSRIITVYSEE